MSGMTIEPEGFLDSVSHTVTGWVWLPADPGRRLRVAVLFSSERSGGGRPENLAVEAVADLHRADLEAAGKGDGRCGFAVPVPAPFSGREHAVDVRLPDFPDARLHGAPRRAVVALGPVILRAARATDSDVERLRAFLAGMVRLNGGCPETAIPGTAELRDWLENTDRRWLVAERDGRIVGQCRVGPEWPAGPESGALALGIELHPDVQGFGLGRHLILAAHRWAAGRCARIELAVLPHNARALHLYRKLGYVDLGPIRLPGTGELHRHMAAALAPQRRTDGFVLVV